MNPEIITQITKSVEEAVDKKINGKLVGIREHLGRQDETLIEVKNLLEERKFLMQLWAFVKVVSGVIVSIGGAMLLYINLNK